MHCRNTSAARRLLFCLLLRTLGEHARRIVVELRQTSIATKNVVFAFKASRSWTVRRHLHAANRVHLRRRIGNGQRFLVVSGVGHDLSRLSERQLSLYPVVVCKLHSSSSEFIPSGYALIGATRWKCLQFHKTRMITATESKQHYTQNCQECQTTLNDMLTAKCLTEGGEHVKQQHVELMPDCVAACSACIDFMSRNSDFHSDYCKALRSNLQSPCGQLREGWQHEQVRRVRSQVSRKLLVDGGLREIAEDRRPVGTRLNTQKTNEKRRCPGEGHGRFVTSKRNEFRSKLTRLWHGGDVSGWLRPSGGHQAAVEQVAGDQGFVATPCDQVLNVLRTKAVVFDLRREHLRPIHAVFFVSVEQNFVGQFRFRHHDFLIAANVLDRRQVALISLRELTLQGEFDTLNLAALPNHVRFGLSNSPLIPIVERHL